MPMENRHGDLASTHAVYHRILQPAYERMIAQNVYKNKISLKSGASGQLLHKRPKTTGYLTKSIDRTTYPTPSTYWNPSVNDSYYWQKSIGPSLAPSTGFTQDGRSLIYPVLTDEFNIKSSTRANSFSATTRVREVPVSSIYKKEIQEFRSRSPSARGVRASALTNRSIIASQVGGTSSPALMSPINHQPSRLVREHAQLEMTRERKRRSQVLSHRVDRMYYMLGSPTKVHRKYDVTEDDLDKIRAIAISRGMKIPPYTYNNRRPSSTTGPHSSPRGQDENFDLSREGSARTIIPTAELSSGGETSEADKSRISKDKEDRSTSDNEGDEFGPDEFDSDLESKKSLRATPLDELNPSPETDKDSVKSDSILIKPGSGKQRSVTFITENDDE